MSQGLRHLPLLPRVQPSEGCIGCCSSQTLPAFHCSRAAWCLLKILSISGCRGATGAPNMPASEHWGELEHPAQCFGALVTRLVGCWRGCVESLRMVCAISESSISARCCTIPVFLSGPSSTRWGWEWEGVLCVTGKVLSQSAVVSLYL